MPPRKTPGLPGKEEHVTRSIEVFESPYEGDGEEATGWIDSLVRRDLTRLLSDTFAGARVTVATGEAGRDREIYLGGVPEAAQDLIREIAADVIARYYTHEFHVSVEQQRDWLAEGWRCEERDSREPEAN